MRLVDPETNPEKTIIPCPECQAGKMHRSVVTYLTYLGDELISVPDFPAWVCDICGRREYDQNALNQLSLILSPTAGTPTPRRRAVKPPRAKAVKEPLADRKSKPE
jgi:YgiT-type zinc finger domain-containing protein